MQGANINTLILVKIAMILTTTKSGKNSLSSITLSTLSISSIHMMDIAKYASAKLPKSLLSTNSMIWDFALRVMLVYSSGF